MFAEREVEVAVFESEPVVFVEGALENGFETIVVSLRDGVVLVRMALGALEGQAQYSCSNDRDCVVDDSQSLWNKVHGAGAGLVDSHA